MSKFQDKTNDNFYLKIKFCSNIFGSTFYNDLKNHSKT